MIPGIILAAGRSVRMGRSKALLPIGLDGPSFVRRLARVLQEGGAADALVVGRDDDDELRAEVEGIGPPVRFVPNPHAEAGQLSSLIAGLNAADRPGIHAVLVTPVDLPLISPDTISAILAAFSSSTRPIARAVHGGRHGHPVIFGRTVFDELRHADPRIGAKAVLRAHASSILDVEVPDPGVLVDVDTPEEYERLLSRGF